MKKSVSILKIWAAVFVQYVKHMCADHHPILMGLILEKTMNVQESPVNVPHVSRPLIVLLQQLSIIIEIFEEETGL
jgi:hypothetical protein